MFKLISIVVESVQVGGPLEKTHFKLICRLTDRLAGTKDEEIRGALDLVRLLARLLIMIVVIAWPTFRNCQTHCPLGRVFNKWPRRRRHPSKGRRPQSFLQTQLHQLWWSAQCLASSYAKEWFKFNATQAASLVFRWRNSWFDCL